MIVFTDVVDIDDAEAWEQFMEEDLAGRLVNSMAFRMVILLFIVLNTILIALQTDPFFDKQFAGALSALDWVFLTVFIVEILLKWYNGFLLFWTVGWNVFDFGIVAASLLGPSITFLSSGRVLRVLRAVRSLRTLKSISALAGLQIIVQAIIGSLADILNVALLLMIAVFVFSVVGVTLFGSALPAYFGSIDLCMFTLMTMMTQDGWVTIFHLLEDEGMYASAAIYFVIVIIFLAFIFMNMVAGVTVTQLLAVYAARKHARVHAKKRLQPKVGDTSKAPLLPVAKVDMIDPLVWKSQVPQEKPMLDSVTIESFENYLVLLSAFEENLGEFEKLVDSINHTLEEVRGLNAFADFSGSEVSSEEEEEGDIDESTPVPAATGDILSRRIMQVSEAEARRRHAGGFTQRKSQFHQRWKAMFQEIEHQTKMERASAWAAASASIPVGEDDSAGLLPQPASISPQRSHSLLGPSVGGTSPSRSGLYSARRAGGLAVVRNKPIPAGAPTEEALADSDDDDVAVEMKEVKATSTMHQLLPDRA